MVMLHHHIPNEQEADSGLESDTTPRVKGLTLDFFANLGSNFEPENEVKRVKLIPMKHKQL